MVQPITGYFTSDDGTVVLPTPNGMQLWAVGYREWYRQRKPYNLPLGYRRRLCSWVQNTRGDWGQPYSYITTEPQYNQVQSVKDRAYQAFVESAKDACAAATSLAEGREAFGMILKRIGSLTSFARAIRKGRFGDAMKSLELDPSKRNRARWDRSKGASAKWLEFHFGWSPMVGDIYDGAKVLTSPWKDGPVKEGRSARFRNVYPPPGDFSYGHIDDLRYRVRYSAVVRITNPNLYQLSQWGLTNPAEVAWELVPFSFVLDWFTNIGSLLGSMSDLHGITLENPFMSVKCTNEMNDWYSWFPPGTNSLFANGRGYEVTRTLGLNGPSFYIKPFAGFSVSRGATAIALLLGFMPRK